MTNGEKIKEIFPDIELYEKSHDAIQINFSSIWWNTEYKEPATKNDLSHNLCDSCINYGCEFQSGIVRPKCAFYMPPQLEPDNCGKSVLDKIRAEIAELSHYYPMGHDYQIAITRCLAVVDKYKVGSEYKK